jgi:hypothetical protein
MTLITDLFERLGHIFGTAVVGNTAAGTSLPPEYQNIIEDFASLGPPYQTILSSVPRTLTSAQANLSGASSQLSAVASALLIQTINDAFPTQSPTLQSSLQILIAQMLGNYYVSPNAPSVTSITPAGTNAGSDLAFVTSVYRPDGLKNEDLLAETLEIVVQSTAGQVSVIGAPAANNPMGYQWPMGSGANSQVSPSTTANATILTGGNMDSPSALSPNIPNGWLVPSGAGTPGTTIVMSTVAVQQIVVAGTPTLGYYYLVYTDPLTNTQQTAAIPFNGTASAVQSALAALAGLGAVSVTATGTTPNFTFLITFNGVAGPVTALSAINFTDSATFTITTTTAGTTAYAGRSVSFISNNAEHTALIQPVTLQPLTQYAVFARLNPQAGTAAGVLSFELLDGSTNAVVQNAQGVNQTYPVTLSGLNLGAWNAVGTAFQTPATLPETLYFKVVESTVFTNAKSVVIDEIQLVPLQVLYNGGPSLAVFPGIPVNGAQPCTVGDSWALLVANALSYSGAGGFQSWLSRFAQAQNLGPFGLLFPSNSAAPGPPVLIPDSLIT